MLLGRNSIDWVLAYWACVTNGWVAVAANGWWNDDQVRQAVATVSPDLIIEDSAGAGRVSSLPALLFEDLWALRGDGAENTGPARNEDELAVILFTSGTSGSSKAVGLSHRNLIGAAHNIVASRPPIDGELPPPATALLTVPLFHIGAIQQTLLALVNGTTIAFLSGRFAPPQVLTLIERHRISSWAAVPTMVSRVVDELERSPATYDVTSLRSLTMGASAVPAALQERVRTLIPSARKGLSSSYGLTEAGGAVAAAAGSVLIERAGTVGRVLPTVEVRIAEPDPTGIGRIWVRSPSVMAGYLGSNEDDPIDDDRWLDTGDLGWVDEDGYLYLEGRAKDIVIRGGENVSCSRVERRLLEHPAVAEVAVVGLPHDDLGEIVAAAIVLRDGSSSSPAELADFAKATLPYFEVPTSWWFRDEELPKTESGKVIKRTIVAEWCAAEQAAS
jgi:long-chain acyl-CoA synthetase